MNQKRVPWLEKYRPNQLDDIVGNDGVIEKFKIFSRTGNIPNFILSGPPGIGKTTTILCLAHQLLGDHFKDAVLELNASNERGIDVVRNKIKMFAQSRMTLEPHQHKIVILDEADSMTDGAQQALRRTMEIFSTTTRFALACNTSEKIIEPIQSRCAVIRFGKLPDEKITKKLIEICKKEQLDYDEEGIEAIVFTAQGDLRQAINNLQSVADGYDGKITSVNVFKICDEPHPLYIKEMFKLCLEEKFDSAYAIVANLCNLGYSADDIIANILRVCKRYPMPEYLKLEFIREIGFTQLRIHQGIHSPIQFAGLFARLVKKQKIMANH